MARLNDADVLKRHIIGAMEMSKTKATDKDDVAFANDNSDAVYAVGRREQGDFFDYIVSFAEDLASRGVTVQKWISVKDRLPEKEVKVLTFGVYGFSVNYRDRFSGKWRGVNGRSQWISHWMPLPEPPSGADMRESKEEK